MAGVIVVWGVVADDLDGYLAFARQLVALRRGQANTARTELQTAIPEGENPPRAALRSTRAGPVLPGGLR